MNNFKVGFGRVVINPTKIGMEIDGYYQVRKVEGILDNLEINALAISLKEKKAIILSVDHCGIENPVANKIRSYVSAKTKLPIEAIILAATHTHTAPYMRINSKDKLEIDYIDYVVTKAGEVSISALDALSPAKVGWGIGQAKRVAFPRRYIMKDGSIQTNPGLHNPNIISPVGNADENVYVVRFTREKAEDIVLVNFANHPDTIGGNKVSADWPGFLRRTLENAIPNTKCIFLNGTLGDVNHIDTAPKDWELNGMCKDFDDVYRGYTHARHIGNVVVGGVLQVYDKVKYVDIDDICFTQKTIQIEANTPAPEQIPEAEHINNLYLEGKDNELPYEGMELTTVVAEAARIMALKDGPEYFNILLSGLVIGPIAFFGIPGEAFGGIGKAIRESSKHEITITVGLCNGYEGYFPTQEAYDEGGYESRSSIFKSGVADKLIEEGNTLLSELADA